MCIIDRYADQSLDRAVLIAAFDTVGLGIVLLLVGVWLLSVEGWVDYARLKHKFPDQSEKELEDWALRVIAGHAWGYIVGSILIMGSSFLLLSAYKSKNGFFLIPWLVVTAIVFIYYFASFVYIFVYFNIPLYTWVSLLFISIIACHEYVVVVSYLRILFIEQLRVIRTTPLVEHNSHKTMTTITTSDSRRSSRQSMTKQSSSPRLSLQEGDLLNPPNQLPIITITSETSNGKSPSHRSPCRSPSKRSRSPSHRRSSSTRSPRTSPSAVIVRNRSQSLGVNLCESSIVRKTSEPSVVVVIKAPLVSNKTPWSLLSKEMQEDSI